MSVYLNETTRRYIPESCHLHNRRRENQKSHAIRVLFNQKTGEEPTSKTSYKPVSNIPQAVNNIQHCLVRLKTIPLPQTFAESCPLRYMLVLWGFILASVHSENSWTQRSSVVDTDYLRCRNDSRVHSHAFIRFFRLFLSEKTTQKMSLQVKQNHI
jgi:hypothetical protein